MKLMKLTKIALAFSVVAASGALPVPFVLMQPVQAQQQLVAMADPSAMVIICFRMSPRTTDTDKQAVISFLSSQGLTSVGFKSNGYECTGQGTCSTVMQMMNSQLYVAQLTLSNQMILAYRFDPLPTNPITLKNKARFAYVAEAPGYGSGGNTAYNTSSGQSGQSQTGQGQYGQGQYGQGQYGQGQYSQGQTGQYSQGQTGQGQFSQGQSGNGQYTTGSQFNGSGSQFSGNGSQFAGNGSQFSGNGSQFSGNGSQFGGNGSQFSGNGSQFSGNGSQFSGNGSQIAGNGSQFAGNGSQFAGNGSQYAYGGTQNSNGMQFGNAGGGGNGQVQTSPFGNTTPTFNPAAPQWYPDPLKTGVNGLAPPSAMPTGNQTSTAPAYNPNPNTPAYSP